MGQFSPRLYSVFAYFCEIHGSYNSHTNVAAMCYSVTCATLTVWRDDSIERTVDADLIVTLMKLLKGSEYWGIMSVFCCSLK